MSLQSIFARTSGMTQRTCSDRTQPCPGSGGGWEAKRKWTVVGRPARNELATGMVTKRSAPRCCPLLLTLTREYHVPRGFAHSRNQCLPISGDEHTPAGGSKSSGREKKRGSRRAKSGNRGLRALAPSRHAGAGTQKMRERPGVAPGPFSRVGVEGIVYLILPFPFSSLPPFFAFGLPPGASQSTSSRCGAQRRPLL